MSTDAKLTMRHKLAIDEMDREDALNLCDAIRKSLLKRMNRILIGPSNKGGEFRKLLNLQERTIANIDKLNSKLCE